VVHIVYRLKLKSVLTLPENETIGYQVHAEAMAKNSR